MKPRVLQVISHLGLGGAEMVALSIIRDLHRRFDFSVYAPCGIQPGSVGRRMRRELEELQVPVLCGTRFEIKRGGLLIAGWKLAAAIRRFRPHLVHLHTEIPEASYATAAVLDPRVRRAALARTIHNSVYWTPRRWLGAWCERRMRRSYVVAVSEPALHAFEEVRRQSGAGPLPSPPRVIFNGVKVSRARQIGQGSSERTIRMLFAGRLEPQKGADLLPRIIPLVRVPAQRELALDIFGEGAFYEQLSALARNPPAGWHIRVEQPIADLKDRICDYDLVLMPSRFEGLSILAMESLLSGVPIVATRAPGLRDGLPIDYPWLCEPGNADAFARLLTKVCSVPETWARVAHDAHRYARDRFDAAAMCAAYAALYDDILARERPEMEGGAETSNVLEKRRLVPWN